MLDSHQPHSSPAPVARPPKVDFAKFPPDDGDLLNPPPGGGIPAGGGYDIGDGNFKRGRFSIAAIIVGILAVAALTVFLIIGFKQEEERVGVEDAEKIKKALYMKPPTEQVGEWRKWAVTQRSDYLKQEALKQLAWAKDPEGVDLAIKALSDMSEPIQAMGATALAEYKSPMADKAKPALLAALKKAGPGSKPQIAWALVELGEASAFNDIMVLYRAGHLSKVMKLNGVVAFDPDKIVRLVSLDQLAQLAGDPSESVRQLVATVLSRHAEAKFTDPLIKLVQDNVSEVARQAAPGLGKIGDERAREPLLKALKTADKDSRKKFLEALRDGIGAKGLVLAIDSVSEDRNLGWFQTQQIFDILEGSIALNMNGLNDPRGGDSLAAFIDKKPHIHWQTRAAFALAKVGDMRAVPTLAKRLRMDPLKIYGDDTDFEMALKRDDNERVVSSRMIADLAQLYPDKAEQLREQAEDALIFWIHELPSPHANGLRALAAMGSTKDIEALRKWSHPDVPLPKEGQQPPMPEEWVVAQSAMRYIGWLKDERSGKWFEEALKKRPKEVDVTMDSLMSGGLAVLGMSLKAIGTGAANGMGQWGDPKSFKPLMTYIEGKMENEQSRMDACAALAWVATPEDMVTVAKKIQEYDKPEKSHQFIRACLLETLITRPIPGTAPELIKLINVSSEPATRHQAARAVGKAGLTPEVEAQLFELLKDEALMNDAALALMLGGSPSTAARSVAMFADKDKSVLEELQELWYFTFGYWSDEDLDKGRIGRWVDNAVAISHVQIRQTPQEWATAQLERQFNNLYFDNGPHSFTRVVLRVKLYQTAKGPDKEKREAAIRTLSFMKEQGMLLALRDEPGEVGSYASEAYHDLMNPKILTGVKEVADDKAKKPAND